MKTKGDPLSSQLRLLSDRKRRNEGGAYTIEEIIQSRCLQFLHSDVRCYDVKKNNNNYSIVFYSLKLLNIQMLLEKHL